MPVSPSKMREASFRGIQFFVESDDISGYGRHAPKHEYVASEAHSTEDLGKKTGTIKVQGYVASDTAYDDARAVFEACNAPGSGTLVLPEGDVFQVRCINVSRKADKKKIGFVAFDFEFVEAGGAPGPATTPLFDRVLSAGLLGLPALLAAAIGQATPVSALNIPVALEQSKIAVALFESARTDLVLDTASDLRSFSELQDVASALPALNTQPDISRWVANLATVVSAMSQDAEASSARQAWNLMISNAQILTPVALSDGQAIVQSLGVKINAVAQALGVSELARCTATATYGSGAEAAAAKASLDLVSTSVLENTGVLLGPDVFALISSTVELAMQQLTSMIIDRTPVVTVEATETYSATLAAYTLYGDPPRAAEIIARNRLGTPSFLPRKFEALVE